MLVRRGNLKLLFITTVVLAGCGSKNDETQPGRPKMMAPEVEGFLVQERTISDKIEVSGSLLPSEQTQIKSEISGRVVQLNIKEGSVVSKGAVMVKLFDADLQAQLKKLKVQLEIAKKTQERQSELLKINGISQQEYDLADLNVQ